MPLLKVTDLWAHYGELVALSGISIEVRERELVAIVGANGAGKSTLLAGISGLLRQLSGSIIFAGKELVGSQAGLTVAAGLVHVPEGRRLFPFMSVEENLLMGAYNSAARGLRRETLEYVFSLLPKLRERRRQAAGTLSGGEQQMCAIGRGLMARPKMLMLDEPTLGLAPMLAAEILQLAADIRASGTTVLLVEQQVGKALQLADRGYVLERGGVVMQDTGAALLSNAELRRAYMGI